MNSSASARPRGAQRTAAPTELAREINRASAFLFGRWYVWVLLRDGRLSLRSTGLR